MIRRYTKEMSVEDLSRLGDEQIDTSDIPELDDAFRDNARLLMPEET